MRSIWNGAISFGLVSIPIKLVNATENHSISFRQIHTEDGGRIRYRKVCELEEREVTSAEIGKGYEDADGSIIPITDQDLAALPIPTAKTIEIVAFVPAERIDPLQIDAAYYLSANGVPAAKPYTLLREALKRSQKVAIAKYALRGRERLGMLRVVDDVIAMHGLLWPDEIREPEGVAPDSHVTVRDAELDLADALMDTLGDVDMSTLHDDYRSAVEELIAAKVEGGTPAEQAPAAEAGGGKVIDLMAALENSVRAARTARGESDESDQGDQGDEGGAEAEVTQLRSRRAKSASAPARKSSPATPKQVGGKKSTSTTKKKEAPARKTTSKTAAKTAARAEGKTEGKAEGKSTAAARKSTAGKSAAGKTAASKTAAKKTTQKKTASAKKTTAKRRASA
ncbi:Ku protein [Streptomyces sp. WAC 01529]|uniref:non-homologous end joining protein Ku n=1 Tax=Streptomyces sp. WAC 01529 TaxID=2203205 RepID=UPI000F715F24|nr:Ku protein [Streptomyces sp. WAC 01529]AZM55519.1 Ku protein [Streptomyces sp. WAC 01529]